VLSVGDNGGPIASAAPAPDGWDTSAIARIPDGINSLASLKLINIPFCLEDASQGRLDAVSSEGGSKESISGGQGLAALFSGA